MPCVVWAASAALWCAYAPGVGDCNGNMPSCRPCKVLQRDMRSTCLLQCLPTQAQAARCLSSDVRDIMRLVGAFSMSVDGHGSGIGPGEVERAGCYQQA